MIIRKIDLKKKKGQAIGINKIIAIALVILVVAIAFVFLLRANLSKWLGFLPDYKAPEESQPCVIDDTCKVTNEKCFCKSKTGVYQPCLEGEYCYRDDVGCLKEKISGLECKK